MTYDLLIVGAGPAGLSAALDAKYLNLRTLVIEAERAGGALSQTYPWKMVDSYLGFRKMKGNEVAEKMVRHAKDEGIEIREFEEVREIQKKGKLFIARTPKGEYEAKAVILAVGVRGAPRKLGIPGEELEGVEHFVLDPNKFRGRRVLVVGGGDSAADSALGLDNAGAKVWLAHRRDELRATEDNKERISKSGVETLWNTEVESIKGEGKAEKALLVNKKNNEKKEMPFDHIFICIGTVPVKDHLENLGIKMDSVHAEIDSDGMTSVQGIFAAGDLVCRTKRIPQALATGERAAYSAYKFIKSPYWK
jgi:thioredoxin reductase (NADPH)